MKIEILNGRITITWEPRRPGLEAVQEIARRALETTPKDKQ